MVSIKDQVWPPDNRTFKHFISYLPWDIQLRGHFVCSACYAGDISSRPSAAKPRLWRDLFPAPCRNLVLSPKLQGRTPNPDCCESATSPQNFVSLLPSRLAAIPVLFWWESSNFSAWRSTLCAAAALGSPTFRLCQNTHRGTTLWRAGHCTFSPICHNWSRGWCS